MKLNVPSIFKPLYKEDARYYFLKGGRGSGKSWAIVDHLLYLMIQNQNLNLVCLREVQRSIKHSSRKLIADRIEAHKLNSYFDILDSEIRCKMGRGVIIFQGLQQHTVDSIKSLEGFDLAFVEEAMTVSAYSLELLTPTIRKDGSKLLFSYNPKREDDPVTVLSENVDNKVVIHANYLDNPFCPVAITEEANAMKKRRYKKYRHVFLGETGQEEGVIFENVQCRPIQEAEVVGLELVQGLDFGYTQDPSAFCKSYIDVTKKIIYVYDGFYHKGLQNIELVNKIKSMKSHRHMTTGDSSEPKSIDYISAKGVRIRGARKGKDSIISGIDFLLEFDIVVNNHLTDFMTEFDNYTWMQDKLTGKAINKPIDEFNHFVDSLRYSVEHLHLRRGTVGRVGKPRGI